MTYTFFLIALLTLLVGFLLWKNLWAFRFHMANIHTKDIRTYLGASTSEDQVAHYQDLYESQRQHIEVTRWGGGL